MILDDANSPAVEGGHYVIAYGELVDGYRHAYATTTKPDGRGRKIVQYSRSANHPPDPRCPECSAPVVGARTEGVEPSSSHPTRKQHIQDLNED